MNVSVKADLKGKRVLFLAYFFPPITSTGVPGAMRTIKFVRNMTNGDFHVLTTLPSVSEDKSALSHIKLPVNNEKIYRVKPWDLFKSLLALRQLFKKRLTAESKAAESSISEAAPFKSTQASEAAPNRLQAFKDFIYNACYFPDQAGPWILPAIKAGRKIIQDNNIDVIFATGSPWSALITGYYLSKLSGKPLIVDFRDPWINNPFHHSKGRLLDRLASNIEAKIVAHASVTSLNTDALRKDFLQRYWDIPEDRFVVLPNGFDESDFHDVKSESGNVETNLITLCHTGFLYGVRDPAVLLEAIRSANKILTGSGNRKFRFLQVGNVSLDYSIEERFADLISEGSLVLTPPTSYRKCLATLSSADFVVNVQPNTNTQVPSKLYDYLALRKPIINITPPSGALGRLVSEKGLGDLFDFDEKDALTDYLVQKGKTLSGSHDFPGYKNRSDFDCSKITEDLVRTIEKACRQ